MENKQTAVEWLWSQIIAKTPTRGISDNGEFMMAHWIYESYYQAKQMEKEQIIQAVYDSMGTNFDPNQGRAEQYYNEKYGE